MFSYYTSIPTVIKAVQFTDQNKDQVFNSLTGQYAADYDNFEPIIKVTTIHGDIAIVRFGDWIIEDSVPGTYYPVKDEVFQNKYRRNKQ